MTEPTIDFSRYRDVRRWSDLPLSEYRLVSSGSYVQASSLFSGKLAAWNVFWATASRLDLDSEAGPVYLLRFPADTERKLFRLPQQRVQLVPPGLNKWTLSAAMCRYSPAEFMHHYWPQISRALKLPHGHGHVFLE